VVEVTEKLVGAVDEVNDHFVHVTAQRNISEEQALQIGLEEKRKEFRKKARKFT
jgi:hypothetical protein